MLNFQLNYLEFCLNADGICKASWVKLEKLGYNKNWWRVENLQFIDRLGAAAMISYALKCLYEDWEILSRYVSSSYFSTLTDMQ